MLSQLLDDLTVRARAQGLTDAEWSRRAGLRKETLSRLRRRNDCDLRTLHALAREVGAALAVGDAPPVPRTAFPDTLDRDDEAQLLALAARGPANVHAWRHAGSRDFMAGLAVMLASERGPDRPRWLALAEQLYPGATHPDAFQAWLHRSPVRPSRFLPMLDAMRRHA